MVYRQPAFDLCRTATFQSHFISRNINNRKYVLLCICTLSLELHNIKHARICTQTHACMHTRAHAHMYTYTNSYIQTYMQCLKGCLLLKVPFNVSLSLTLSLSLCFSFSLFLCRLQLVCQQPSYCPLITGYAVLERFSVCSYCHCAYNVTTMS